MTDIKTILCPVDFSEASHHAIDHAIVIARWYDASIAGLHVYNPVFMPVPGLVVADDEVVRQGERQRLCGETTHCFSSATAAGIDVRVLVDEGPPATCILDRAASLPADLVVIGTHGLSGFEHLVLGSVTEKVLRRATCPVLTVPPRARATSKLPFKRLLCPVDFSPASNAALRLALSFAQEGDAELTILHVIDWPVEDESLRGSSAVSDYVHERERAATEALETLVPDSAREWCHPTPRLGHGKPYREILGVATEGGADLIVMGVHGRNALELMLFGSTTNQVVRRATCPVLTLRARE